LFDSFPFIFFLGFLYFSVNSFIHIVLFFSIGSDEDGDCKMCGRQTALTRHHVRPKEIHPKLIKRGLFTKEQLGIHISDNIFLFVYLLIIITTK
jgi:hypothetical protein